MDVFASFFWNQKRSLKKAFSILPTKLSNDKIIWLKPYIQYKTFGHGMVLGGSVKSHYSKDGKKVFYTSRQASFFPSSKTEWIGTSPFQLRNHLRKNNDWKSKFRQKEDQITNIKTLASWLDKDESWIQHQIKKLNNKGSL